MAHTVVKNKDKTATVIDDETTNEFTITWHKDGTIETSGYWFISDSDMQYVIRTYNPFTD